MRIIAGKRKKMLLKSPKGSETRPTTDRIKENMFNLIQAKVPGSHVLDLFSGTGALGIEAMSRGARDAVFVESDKQAYGILCENLHKVEDLGPMYAYRQDVFDFINKTKSTFDLVFLDPPYRGKEGIRAIEKLLEGQRLAQNAILILESHKDEPGLETLFCADHGLTLEKDRKYGSTMLRLYGFKNA